MSRDIGGPKPSNEVAARGKGGASQKTSTERQHPPDTTPADGKTSGNVPRLAFLIDGAPEAERIARLREMRVVVALLCGWGSPAKRAIDQALAGGSDAAALTEIDRLPALRRRRILATFGALLPKGRGR